VAANSVAAEFEEGDQWTKPLPIAARFADGAGPGPNGAHAGFAGTNVWTQPRPRHRDRKRSTRHSSKETSVRCPADQLRIKTDWPGRFTIGDQDGAILHILLPCRTAQNPMIARQRLRELAAICGIAADAILADDT
jgi:hypothetical protein